MSWLSSAFGGYKNPNTEANKYLDQIPGQTKPYYDPYINAGKHSLETLTGEYDTLTNDPGKRFDELGAGYKNSPGYAATLRTALSGANRAAAMGQGGGLGSYGHQQMAAGAAGDVANKDFEQYINHILGLHTEGLQGNQTLETQGQNASTEYAQMIASLLNSQGTNAANATSGQNQRTGQNWSNLFNVLGSIGGGIVGGPIGSAIGGAITNHFSPNHK